MTRPERQPSPFPGLKKMVEWESVDRESGACVDPKTRFLCPGCGVNAWWFNVCCQWQRSEPEIARIAACVYASEHERMHTYQEVTIAQHGTRLRFLGERFDVDFDPSWASGWAAERVGWVGELQRQHDYDHRIEVATQEIWVNFSATCWELAGSAPLGPLGGPREHSTDRTRWALTGNSWLSAIARNAAEARAKLGATVPESLRLARVDLECFIVQNRKWQAEFERERKERERKGEPPPCR